MRKKTVNHVADTIFWYVLYFLPIISYLLFCFCEPVRLDYSDNTSNTETVSTMSIETFVLDNDYNYIPAGSYVFNEVLDFTGFPTAAAALEGFDAVSNSLAFNRLSVSPSFIPREFSYGQTLVYTDGVGWVDDAYRYITFNDNVSTLDTGATFNFLDFFNTNLTVFSPVEPDIPIEPTLTIVPFYDYMISAYSFTENNFIYTTITDLFGVNGVFNLALDNGIYLYFSWFIGVYLMHLFVDFLLFIPRLCHKWLKEFTQGD